MMHMCPHCGINLIPDDMIESGPWRVTPCEAWFGQDRLALTPGEAGTLYTIAAGRGRRIRAEAISNRIGNARETSNVAQVMVCRLRKKLGPCSPIRSERGRAGGYWWEVQP
jgi:DNA-binding response OmpR family regulator